jgi:hypothetical protein
MTGNQDNQDNPGIRVPPPLIYVLPLILGLLLDRRAHLPFLRRSAARSLGWPLIGGGVVLSRWFLQTRCVKPTRRYAPTSPCRD